MTGSVQVLTDPGVCVCNSLTLRTRLWSCDHEKCWQWQNFDLQPNNRGMLEKLQKLYFYTNTDTHRQRHHYRDVRIWSCTDITVSLKCVKCSVFMGFVQKLGVIPSSVSFFSQVSERWWWSPLLIKLHWETDGTLNWLATESDSNTPCDSVHHGTMEMGTGKLSFFCLYYRRKYPESSDFDERCLIFTRSCRFSFQSSHTWLIPLV